MALENVKLGKTVCELGILATTDQVCMFVFLVAIATTPHPHRFHLIGLLVLFVQDIGDIALEFSKSIIYFKDRNGRSYYWPEFFANVGFGFFTIQQ